MISPRSFTLAKPTVVQMDMDKKPPPPERDVRGEIVALMREASMSKDKGKLEAAIKKAEEAGLQFEANQGRRQLGRITG